MMVLKEFFVVICFAKLASTVPYQYNYPTSFSTTSTFSGKPNGHGDVLDKFHIGYKTQESPKVKKEFSDSEYQTLFTSEGVKRPYPEEDILPFGAHDDGGYSTKAGPIAQYPYSNQLTFDYPTVSYPKPKAAEPTKAVKPVIADSKVFIHHGPHHHHDLFAPFHHKKHFVNKVVGHYISDVAGHKIKHVGEVLESGALNEPIIHKLKFAKAALLPLVAIIGSLSAINGVNFVAKASNPHAHAHEPEGHPIAGLPEHEVFGHSHHPNTLVGLIYHFLSQLSRVNNEAKAHLVPNLLQILSKTSASSAHASGHHVSRR